jgi:hypothetical protein
MVERAQRDHVRLDAIAAAVTEGVVRFGSKERPRPDELDVGEAETRPPERMRRRFVDKNLRSASRSAPIRSLRWRLRQLINRPEKGGN